MSTAPVEPTPEPTPTPAATPAPAAAAPAEPATTPAKKSLEDLLGSLDDDARTVVLGEVQKARSEAKNLRDRLKEAEPIVTEWRKLEEASKTELEKAQAAAQQATGNLTALREQVAQAKVEAALTGIVPDPAAIVADLNLSKYLTEDGQVDTEAVTALRDKFAALAPAKPGAPAPNPAQGSSSAGPSRPAQMTKEEVERLYAERKYDEIDKARAEGRLDQLLGA